MSTEIRGGRSHRIPPGFQTPEEGFKQAGKALGVLTGRSDNPNELNKLRIQVEDAANILKAQGEETLADSLRDGFAQTAPKTP